MAVKDEKQFEKCKYRFIKLSAVGLLPDQDQIKFTCRPITLKIAPLQIEQEVGISYLSSSM